MPPLTRFAALLRIGIIHERAVEKTADLPRRREPTIIMDEPQALTEEL
jgi:hypothetical protein